MTPLSVGVGPFTIRVLVGLSAAMVPPVIVPESRVQAKWSAMVAVAPVLFRVPVIRSVPPLPWIVPS
jgi:hypothetical protein